MLKLNNQSCTPILINCLISIALNGLASNAALAGVTTISLQEPGFETPSMATGFIYNPAGTSWSFTGGSGVQGNGSAWGAPAAPNGNQTAFLQSLGAISQAIEFPSTGDYTVSFSAANRASDPEPHIQQIVVHIDGSQIGVASASGVYAFQTYSFPFSATAGPHTITFSSTVPGGDHSAFLDAVTISAAPSAPPFDINPSFELPALNGNFQYQPSATESGWTFSFSTGIQCNGSAWGAPPAPRGTQTAFLQGLGTITQTINFPAGGDFKLGFSAANRASDPAPHVQQIAVSIDGSQIGIAPAQSVADFESYSFPFSVSAGPHTIAFASTVPGGDHSAFLDAISIEPAGVVRPSLVSNGGFESPPVGNSLVIAPGNAGWTFIGEGGIQGNGSELNAPDAPDGTQTAFLKAARYGAPGSAATSFIAPALGQYSLSVKAAQSLSNAIAQQVRVTLDGVQVALIAPPGAAYTSYVYPFSLAPGTHNLTFTALQTAEIDYTATLVDDVRIVLEEAVPDRAIYNRSFEIPFIGTGYLYQPMNAGWTFTGQSGIQGNGSAWNAVTAPDGIQTAFLQSAHGPSNGPGRISTTIDVPITSQYVVSLTAALRPNNSQRILVSLDGEPVGIIVPTSTSFVSYSISLVAAMGSHTLSFEAADNAGDNTAFIDAINIAATGAQQGAAGFFDTRWAGFLSALDAGNADAAAQFIASESRAKYRQAFIDLGTEMQNISPNLSGLFVGKRYGRY